METRVIPLTVMEVVDMLISGREKLAKELMTELYEFERCKVRRTFQKLRIRGHQVTPRWYN